MHSSIMSSRIFSVCVYFIWRVYTKESVWLACLAFVCLVHLDDLIGRPSQQVFMMIGDRLIEDTDCLRLDDHYWSSDCGRVPSIGLPML